MQTTQKTNILLGVTGSIATYKALEIVRMSKSMDWSVQVVMTKSATFFVHPLSFQALSKNKVFTDLFEMETEGQIDHIHLSQSADILLIAPATANFIAKCAQGIADDLLSTMYLATTAQVIFVPAMNTVMWNHPSNQKNIAFLKKNQAIFVEPESGYLACETIGQGRLASIERIIQTVIEHNPAHQPLTGATVLVTAGPTRQPIDPFRFITNASSGKMGVAIAQECIKLGAKTTLILGPSNLEPPVGLHQIHHIKTTAEFESCFMQQAKKHDIVVQAAAVSDYATAYQDKKMKASSIDLPLQKEKDFLQQLTNSPTPPKVVVGFAAETDNLEANSEKKKIQKNCDILVGNLISDKKFGFGSDYNKIILLTKTGIKKPQPNRKTELAKEIVAEIIQAYHHKTSTMPETNTKE